MEAKSKFPRIRVQFDIEYKGTPGDVNKEKSLTVPDMNLTVRQMLDNYTRTGDPGPLSINEPMYFDMEIPTFEDFADVQAHREFLERQLEAAEEWIKNNQDEQEILEEESGVAEDN